jgi:transcriptional regulator with XRE-family HTH domain
MQDLVVGSIVRAVRRRLGLRQSDVAERAGVSQQTVSVIELGRLDEVDLATLRRVCAVLGIDISLAPRWHGPDLDQLLDAGHASIVEAVEAEFRAASWTVEVDWSFSHFGERGAVDILAWMPERRALAVVEVKTRVVDLQDLLGALDRKVRLARELLPAERGWQPVSVGRIVVLPDRSSARDAVARHAVTFSVVLPGRTVETRRWIRDPASDLRSVWFLRGTTPAGAPEADRVPRQRIRARPRRERMSNPRDTTGAGATG